MTTHPARGLFTLAATVIGAAALSTAAFAGGHAAKLDVPSGAYQMDPTHASVTWRIGHLGLSNYTARFTKFDIKLDLNAEDPTKSTVTATVDPTSVETDYSGSKDFNGEIATGAKFLDGGAHPEITFTSKSIELGDGKTGTMTGDVTLLGVTKPVTFDVTLNGALKEHPFAKKPAVGFGATGTIKRSEFGLTHLIPFVSDEVDVIIEAEFLKQ